MKIAKALWPRLMPLLDQALELPAEQRSDWLQSLALDDEARAALGQLLADRQALDAADFMAALPVLSGAMRAGPGVDVDAHADATAASGAAQVGLFKDDVVGPYRLLRPLGQGGMSVVWLAVREDGQLHRQVALKMPHAGPGQALLAARLRRERDILASLEHRHIARLYDVGVSAQGLPFMALEYIEGLTLPAHCDQHQLGIEARLRLFLQVLSAVQYAHTKLVLHRDLKPGNILVNLQGEVKLLDFGIAKLMRDGHTAAAASTELTQHSGHVLTPDYAAPEQIAGKPLTTASDVYALGVLLFELLTDQRPYRLPRGTRGALEDAILATDPRQPSQVWLDGEVQTHTPGDTTLIDLAQHFHTNPRKLHQQLRGDLDVIVATALQKTPARRYATVEAFAQDIAHHLANEPIAAQPDSAWYRTRKYTKRHAWALSALGAVVVALSTGLGMALWQAREARQEAAKAVAIKDFLVGLFENGDVEQADGLHKRQQTVEQLLTHSALALNTELKNQPQVRADLQGVVGHLLHDLGITDAAIQVRQQRAAQLEAMHASVAERAQAWRDLADSQDARGDTVSAKQSLSQGQALCATADMTPAGVCWGLQVAMGHQLMMANQVDAAAALITPALAALRTRAPHTTQLADALEAQGDALSIRGEAVGSYALFQQALALRSQLWGANSIKLAQVRHALAMSLWAQRRLTQAHELLTQSWQAMAASLGVDHTQSLAVELQLGNLEAMKADTAGGLDHVTHAATHLLSRAQALDPRTVYDAEGSLGEALLADGHLEQAGPHLLRALDLASTLKGQMPDYGDAEGNYAWYLHDIGQYDQARQILMQARGRLIATLGESSREVANLDERIAWTYLAQKQWDNAIKTYRKGLATQDFREDQFGSAKHGMSSGLAMVHMERGHYAEAATVVNEQYEAMRHTPASEQYKLTLYAINDRMARLQAGLNHCDKALPYFEQAIAVLQGGNPRHPYLVRTRSRYGLCLMKLGRTAQAHEQWRLANTGIKAHAVLGPHITRPFAELSQQLHLTMPDKTQAAAR